MNTVASRWYFQGNLELEWVYRYLDFLIFWISADHRWSSGLEELARIAISLRCSEETRSCLSVCPSGQRVLPERPVVMRQVMEYPSGLMWEPSLGIYRVF